MQKALEAEALKVEIKNIELDQSVTNITQVDETKGWAQVLKIDATVEDTAIENVIKEQ